MARKGTGKQRGRLADMSLPPEERRRRGGRAPDPVPAQMDHGNTPRDTSMAFSSQKKTPPPWSEGNSAVTLTVNGRQQSVKSASCNDLAEQGR